MSHLHERSTVPGFFTPCLHSRQEEQTCPTGSHLQTFTALKLSEISTKANQLATAGPSLEPLADRLSPSRVPTDAVLPQSCKTLHRCCFHLLKLKYISYTYWWSQGLYPFSQHTPGAPQSHRRKARVNLITLTMAAFHLGRALVLCKPLAHTVAHWDSPSETSLMWLIFNYKLHPVVFNRPFGSINSSCVFTNAFNLL